MSDIVFVKRPPSVAILPQSVDTPGGTGTLVRGIQWGFWMGTVADASWTLKTILLCDLVDSTGINTRYGENKSARLFAMHKEIARRLLRELSGEKINESDGLLAFFDLPIHAVQFSIRYHGELRELSRSTGVELKARVGVHAAQLLMHRDDEGKIDPYGVDIAITARLMSLGAGGQTLLTKQAFDFAQRLADDAAGLPQGLQWQSHGSYRFKGVDRPEAVFEVGLPEHSPLRPPSDSEKAWREVSREEEELQGWRPAPGHKIPSLPKYTLVRKLGEGGHGEVWLARHGRSREEHVFKFCFEPARLRRLRDETVIFQYLKDKLPNRPDIARVHDWNLERAPYFIELDYAPGGSLDEWLDRPELAEPVPLEARLCLVAQTAEAVAAAHNAGVLHKDIKPSNVLIWFDNDEPRARLTDFGVGMIAPAAGTDGGAPPPSADPAAGIGGSSEGGGAYLAPELTVGDEPTILSDVYSLGVLLYHMLIEKEVVKTRRRWPPLAYGWEESVRRALEHRSDVVMTQFLIADIAACVHANPTLRLSSAMQLANRLRDLDGRVRRHRDDTERHERAVATAAEAKRKSDEEAARRRRQLRRWRAIAGGLVALMALAIGFGVWVNHKRHVATLRREEGRRHAQALSVARDKAVSAFGLFSDVAARMTGPDRSYLWSMIAGLGAQALRNDDVPACRHMHYAELFAHIGAREYAVPHLEKAITLHRKAGDEAAELEAQHQLGIALRLGKYPDSESDQRKRDGKKLLLSVMERRDVLARTNQSMIEPLLESWHVVAWAEHTDGAHTEALSLMRKAYERRRSILGSTHEDTIKSQFALARWSDDPSEKDSLLTDVLARRRERLGDAHPDTAAAALALAEACLKTERLDKAGALAVAGYRSRRDFFGPSHERVVEALRVVEQVCDAHRARGEQDRAERLRLELDRVAGEGAEIPRVSGRS